MGLLNTERERRYVIPRWRDFKVTSKEGELYKERHSLSPIIPKLSILRIEQNWRTNRTISNAIELVNAAYVANEKEIACDAAQFIVDNCTDERNHAFVLSRSILQQINSLNGDQPSPTSSFEDLNNRIGIKIREIRTRLKLYPYNPILNVDLARWYTVIGKFVAAEKHIKIALHLAPTNVFVLRSAVRFFLHKSRYDKLYEDSLSYALQLLRKNPATKFDPWLLATEISLCGYLEKRSKLIKQGFSVIESRNFSPFVLSELSSALATEELSHSTKRARNLFSKSLLDPNENTVAQAQWATNIVGKLPLYSTNRNSFEANSFECLIREDWDKGFDEALNWIIDQPFSREPAHHASYIAGAIIDDPQLAVKICDFGLRANPQDFALLNNKAFSLASQGHADDAERAFRQIDVKALKEIEMITYAATEGLLSYAKGNHEAGDLLYTEAEFLARKNRDERTAFRVKIYKTRAEFTFGANQIDENTAINNLIEEGEKYKHPDIKKIIKNLQTKLVPPA